MQIVTLAKIGDVGTLQRCSSRPNFAVSSTTAASPGESSRKMAATAHVTRGAAVHVQRNDGDTRSHTTPRRIGRAQDREFASERLGFECPPFDSITHVADARAIRLRLGGIVSDDDESSRLLALLQQDSAKDWGSKHTDEEQADEVDDEGDAVGNESILDTCVHWLPFIATSQPRNKTLGGNCMILASAPAATQARALDAIDVSVASRLVVLNLGDSLRVACLRRRRCFQREACPSTEPILLADSDMALLPDMTAEMVAMLPFVQSFSARQMLQIQREQAPHVTLTSTALRDIAQVGLFNLMEHSEERHATTTTAEALTPQRTSLAALLHPERVGLARRHCHMPAARFSLLRFSRHTLPIARPQTHLATLVTDGTLHILSTKRRRLGSDGSADDEHWCECATSAVLAGHLRRLLRSALFAPNDPEVRCGVQLCVKDARLTAMDWLGDDAITPDCGEFEFDADRPTEADLFVTGSDSGMVMLWRLFPGTALPLIRMHVDVHAITAIKTLRHDKKHFIAVGTSDGVVSVLLYKPGSLAVSLLLRQRVGHGLACVSLLQWSQMSTQFVLAAASNNVVEILRVPEQPNRIEKHLVTRALLFGESRDKDLDYLRARSRSQQRIDLSAKAQSPLHRLKARSIVSSLTWCADSLLMVARQDGSLDVLESTHASGMTWRLRDSSRAALLRQEHGLRRHAAHIARSLGMQVSVNALPGLPLSQMENDSEDDTRTQLQALSASTAFFARHASRTRPCALTPALAALRTMRVHEGRTPFVLGMAPFPTLSDAHLLNSGLCLDSCMPLRAAPTRSDASDHEPIGLFLAPTPARSVDDLVDMCLTTHPRDHGLLRLRIGQCSPRLLLRLARRVCRRIRRSDNNSDSNSENNSGSGTQVTRIQLCAVRVLQDELEAQSALRDASEERQQAQQLVLRLRKHAAARWRVLRLAQMRRVVSALLPHLSQVSALQVRVLVANAVVVAELFLLLRDAPPSAEKAIVDDAAALLVRHLRLKRFIADVSQFRHSLQMKLSQILSTRDIDAASCALCHAGVSLDLKRSRGPSLRAAKCIGAKEQHKVDLCSATLLPLDATFAGTAEQCTCCRAWQLGERFIVLDQQLRGCLPRGCCAVCHATLQVH